MRHVQVVARGFVVTVSLVWMLVLPGRASAQRVIEPGDRIRLDAPEWYPGYVGEFLGVDHDSLRIQGKRLVLSVPLEGLVGVEVSNGTSTRVPQFAAGGAALGAAGGFVLGVVSCGFLHNDDNSGCKKNLAAVGAGSGFFIGLLVGSQRPSDDWMPASVPRSNAAALPVPGSWSRFLAIPSPVVAPVSFSF